MRSSQSQPGCDDSSLRSDATGGAEPSAVGACHSIVDDMLRPRAARRHANAQAILRLVGLKREGT